MFESGHYLLGIFGIVIVEGAVVSIAARRSRRPFSSLDVVLHLGAGAMLVLAVWSAVVDQPWWLTASLVTASLPLHLFDLRRRWTGAKPTR